MTAQIVNLTAVKDQRGLLTAAQTIDQLPFLPARIFTVSQVDVGTVRGGHAHRDCHQFLMVASGRIGVELDDKEGTRNLILEDPGVGLYIPPLVWAAQTYLSSNAVLIALASEPYSLQDYVDDRALAKKLREETER